MRTTYILILTALASILLNTSAHAEDVDFRDQFSYQDTDILPCQGEYFKYKSKIEPTLNFFTKKDESSFLKKGLKFNSLVLINGESASSQIGILRTLSNYGLPKLEKNNIRGLDSDRVTALMKMQNLLLNPSEDALIELSIRNAEVRRLLLKSINADRKDRSTKNYLLEIQKSAQTEANRKSSLPIPLASRKQFFLSLVREMILDESLLTSHLLETQKIQGPRHIELTNLSLLKKWESLEIAKNIGKNLCANLHTPTNIDVLLSGDQYEVVQDLLAEVMHLPRVVEVLYYKQPVMVK